jgi:hypothetical protein
VRKRKILRQYIAQSVINKLRGQVRATVSNVARQICIAVMLVYLKAALVMSFVVEDTIRPCLTAGLIMEINVLTVGIQIYSKLLIIHALLVKMILQQYMNAQHAACCAVLNVILWLEVLYIKESEVYNK